MPKFCTEGLTSVGGVFLKGEALPTLYLGLYKDTTEPAAGAVMTDLTEAATPGSGGYARVALDPGDWTESPAGTWTCTAQAFTASGADWGLVTGYFITTAATGTAGDLICVKHFPAGPYQMSAGAVLAFKPVVSNITEYSPSSSYVGNLAVVFLPGSDYEAVLPGDYDWFLEDRADRIIDWTYAGIPGGIPVRTTTYTTLSAGATAAEVNAAIAACPSGQIVALGAGAFDFGSTSIVGKSDVTLDGAGPGQTNITSAAGPVFRSAGANVFLEASGIDISSGYTKGSLSITLTTTPSSTFQAGRLIQITQDDDPDVWATGIGVYHRTGLASKWGMSYTRNLRFTSRIESVVGNTINLATPIPVSFSALYSPKAYPMAAAPMSQFGVQNLTIIGAGQTAALDWNNADRCWAYKVEASGFSGGHGFFQVEDGHQCEFRRCYVHDAAGFPSQSDGYAYFLYYGCGYCLIEDSISYRTAYSIINGSSGNAVLFNYAYNIRRGGHGFIEQSEICNHGPHGVMNLYEGNVMQRFQNDGYHGSTSHSTVFRNQIHGTNPDVTSPGNRRIIDLCRGAYYHNVIGNVLGDSSWVPAIYDNVYPSSQATSIYILGWPGMDSLSMSNFTAAPWDNWTKPTDQPDADVAATLLRHGNYDYYNSDTVWDGGITSHELPDSLFYSSKPAYFGSLQWPPIGSDVPGLVTDTPSSRRWSNYETSGLVADLFADAPGA